MSAVGEAMAGLAAGPIRIRVGIHTGEPALDPPKYVGLDVHRAARIMSCAHGGQVVLSRETAELLPDGAFALVDLGDHRFKDLAAPERVYQLGQNTHPPLKSLYRVTLPVPATPFLGREHELATVVGLLTDPATRLLTLTGPGGTGKTRLALQAAAEAADQFVDGITWVPLAPLRDPTLVLPTIAQALDVKEHAGEPLVATVARALLGKKALLLLDNLEHLLPEAATELAALATSCPTLNLLATSRERLHIGIESVWPVPPLTAGDGEQLFVERAPGSRRPARRRRHGARALPPPRRAPPRARARGRPHDRVHSDAAARAARAAPRPTQGRSRQRPAATNAPRDDRLVVPAPRPDEQRVFRALSVFAGGCTYEAAEQVAAADPDTLQSLLDKSLLRRRDEDGEPRYWMLETIRQHAGDALVVRTGRARRCSTRFLEWLAGVVGEVDAYWLDRDQLAWFDTLETERANLLGAIGACRADGRDLEAMRLLLGAFEFFDARGPYAPLLNMTGGVLLEDERLQGRVHLAHGFLRLPPRSLRRLLPGTGSAFALGVSSADDALAARARHMLVVQGHLPGRHRVCGPRSARTPSRMHDGG